MPVNIDFNGPESNFRVLEGEHFVDPGSTCLDRFGQVTCPARISSAFSPADPGPQTITHYCENQWGSYSRGRTVTVDAKPVCQLRGATDIKILGDSEYHDEGATCYDDDEGDGVSAFEDVDELVPFSVHRAGCPGRSPRNGAVEEVFDSIMSDNAQACERGCFRVPYRQPLWVDLGSARVVRRVTIAGQFAGGRIRVGHAPGVPYLFEGTDCATQVSASFGQPARVECKAPLFGRYVALETPDQSVGAQDVLVGEIQVDGAPWRPAPPGQLKLRPCATKPLTWGYAFGASARAFGVAFQGPPWKALLDAGRNILELRRELRRPTDAANPKVVARATTPCTGGACAVVRREEFTTAVSWEAEATRILPARQWRAGLEIWRGEVQITYATAASETGVCTKTGGDLNDWQPEDIIEFDPMIRWTWGAGVMQEGSTFAATPDATSLGAMSTQRVAYREGLTSISVEPGSVPPGTVVRVGLAATSADVANSGCYLTLDGSTKKVYDPMSNNYFDYTSGSLIVVQREAGYVSAYVDNVRVLAVPAAAGRMFGRIQFKGTGGQLTLGETRVGGQAWQALYRGLGAGTFGSILASCGTAPGKIQCLGAVGGSKFCRTPSGVPAYGQSNWRDHQYRNVFGLQSSPALEYDCPGFETPDGSDPCLVLGCYVGEAAGEPGTDQWAVMSAGAGQHLGDAKVSATGGSLVPPLNGWRSQVLGEDPDCKTGARVAFDPEETCSWLHGFSSANDTYRCADSSECGTAGCCKPNGGIAMCPPNKPRMCGDMCNGDYCCSVSCASRQAPERRCKYAVLGSGGSEAVRKRCFQTNTKVTGPITYTATVPSHYDCQILCRSRQSCAVFNFNNATGECVLMQHAVSVMTVSGWISGRSSCEGTQLLTTTTVNTSLAGTYKTVHQGVDSLGAVSVVERTVRVGCEGPNPGGTFGGNKLQCDAVTESNSSIADFEECSVRCFNSGFNRCEAVQHIGSTCQFWVNCTGAYLTDNQGAQKVGYCRRKDRPPRLTIGDGVRLIAVGAVWPIPSCTCYDLEDHKALGNSAANFACTNNAATGINRNVPGIYTVDFVCTDSQGNSKTARKMVTVASDCSPPAATCAGRTNTNTVYRYPVGSNCTSVCGAGYVPNVASANCDTGSEAQFVSRWMPLTPACLPAPCPEPSLAFAQTPPCMESTGSGLIPHNGACTVKCESTLIPTAPVLQCKFGLMQPLTTQCKARATAPSSLYALNTDTLSPRLEWVPQAPGGCEFSRWDVQVRKLSLATWVGVQGTCAGITQRTKNLCNTEDLLEGTAYVFRAREVCLDDRYSSDWTVSPTYTTIVLQPPKIASLNPNGTMTAVVPYILATFDQNLNLGTAGAFSLSRRCGTTWLNDTKPASTIIKSTDPPAVGGATLSAATFTYRPTFTYFMPGCRYYFSFGANLFWSVSGVPKPNALIAWEVNYPDAEPIVEALTYSNIVVDSAGVGMTVNVRFDVPTEYKCTIAARTPTLAPLYPQPWPTTTAWPSILALGGNVIIPDMVAVPAITTATFQQTVAKTTKSFNVAGLVPSKKYDLACSGNRIDRSWVMSACSVDIIGSPCAPRLLDTPVDNNLKAAEIIVYRVAMCADGNKVKEVNIQAPQTITIDQVKDPITVTLEDYETVCLGVNEFNTLQEGEYARIQVRLYIRPDSRFGFVKTTTGLVAAINIQKTYVSSGAPQNDVKQIKFEMCPHSNSISGKACQSSTLEVTGTAGGFLLLGWDAGFRRRLAEDGDDEARPRRLAEGDDIPAGWTYKELEEGAEMTFFLRNRLLDVGVWMGHPKDGFLQEHWWEQANAAWALKWKVDAIGRLLPVYFMYKGQIIDAKWLVSVKGPFLSLSPVLYSDLGKGVLVGNITGGPSKASYRAQADQYFRLSVVKKDTQMPSPGLCIGVQLYTSGWNTVSCDLALLPISNLVVVLEVMDYMHKTWVRVPGSEVENWIRYSRPKLFALSGELVEEGLLDLRLPDFQYNVSGVSYTHSRRLATSVDRTITASGTGFADTKSLEHLREFIGNLATRLVLVNADGSSTVDLCEEVEVKSGVEMTCRIASAVDARKLHLLPPVAVQIGDAISDPLLGTVHLPEARVMKVRNDVFDLGTNDVILEGFGFGWPLSADGNFQQARSDWLASTGGRLAGGLVQLFGAASAELGWARCKVTGQTETQLNCTSTGVVRAQRERPEASHPAGKLIQVEGSRVKIVIGEYHTSLAGVAKTFLRPCEPGEGRVREDEETCELCPEGKFSSPKGSQWPIACDLCSVGTFQDLIGQTECAACPENTRSLAGSTELSDCTCMAGYYSPTFDPNGVTTLPGQACLKCHTDDFLATPPKGLRCDGEGTEKVVNSDVCDAEFVHQCVNTTAGPRLCKIFCPGGRVFPKAKKYFFSTAVEKFQLGAAGSASSQRSYFSLATEAFRMGAASSASPESSTSSASSDTGVGGATVTAVMVRPSPVMCDPPEACMSSNVCAEGYEGKACGVCVFGYFRSKLESQCIACTDGQIIGMIIMAAVCASIACIAFFASLLYLKALSDPVFKYYAIKKMQIHGLDVLPPWLDAIKFRLLHRKIKVHLTQEHCARWWDFIRSKDIGAVFRVAEDTGTAFVAGVRKGSPANAVGIRAGWQLQMVNGSPLHAKSEVELCAHLAKMSMPMTLIFFGNRFRRDTEDDPTVEAINANSEFKDVGTGAMEKKKDIDVGISFVRTFTLCLGILQAFNAVARLALQRTEFFNMVAAIMQQLLLNFDFFHPECSVQAPYEYKWFLYTSMPYLMFIPLTVSFAIIWRISKQDQKSDQQFVAVQRWLLHNAWARATLAILIFFIQVHMEQLSSPFNCHRYDNGLVVMSLAQDIVCNHSDHRYLFIFAVAVSGWLLLAFVYAFVFYSVYRSYEWQSEARMRNRIPLGVALVEMTVRGMRGYIRSVRSRVYTNIVAVRTYPLMEIVEPPVPKEVGEKPSHTSTGSRYRTLKGVQAGDTLPTTAAVDAHVAVGRLNFRKKTGWQDGDDGNMITYGWVLLVNTFVRQFLLMISVLWSSLYPALGAGSQTAIFCANFAMVLLLMPYEQEDLNYTEALLLMLLAALTCMLMYREMMLDNAHKQGRRTQSRSVDELRERPSCRQRPGGGRTLEKKVFEVAADVAAHLIDIMLVIIIAIIIWVLLRAIWWVFRTLMSRPTFGDQLNRAYFTRRLESEAVAKAEGIGKAKSIMLETDYDDIEAWKQKAYLKVKLECRDIMVDLDASKAHETMDIVNQVLDADIFKDKEAETMENLRYAMAELEAEADRRERRDLHVFGSKAKRDAAKDRHKNATNAAAIHTLRQNFENMNDVGGRKGDRGLLDLAVKNKDSKDNQAPNKKKKKGRLAEKDEKEEDETITICVPLFGHQGHQDGDDSGGADPHKKRSKNLAEDRHKAAANAMALSSLRAQAEEALKALEPKRREVAEKTKDMDAASRKAVEEEERKQRRRNLEEERAKIAKNAMAISAVRLAADDAQKALDRMMVKPKEREQFKGDGALPAPGTRHVAAKKANYEMGITTLTHVKQSHVDETPKAQVKELNLTVVQEITPDSYLKLLHPDAHHHEHADYQAELRRMESLAAQNEARARAAKRKADEDRKKLAAQTGASTKKSEDSKGGLFGMFHGSRESPKAMKGTTSTPSEEAKHRKTITGGLFGIARQAKQATFGHKKENGILPSSSLDAAPAERRVTPGGAKDPPPQVAEQHDDSPRMQSTGTGKEVGSSTAVGSRLLSVTKQAKQKHTAAEEKQATSGTSPRPAARRRDDMQADEEVMAGVASGHLPALEPRKAPASIGLFAVAKQAKQIHEGESSESVGPSENGSSSQESQRPPKSTKADTSKASQGLKSSSTVGSARSRNGPKKALKPPGPKALESSSTLGSAKSRNLAGTKEPRDTEALSSQAPGTRSGFLAVVKSAKVAEEEAKRSSPTSEA